MAETKKKTNKVNSTSSKKTNNTKKTNNNVTPKKTSTNKNVTKKKTNTKSKTNTIKKNSTNKKNSTKKTNTKVVKQVNTPSIEKKKEEVIEVKENLAVVSQEIKNDEVNKEVIVENVSPIEEVKNNFSNTKTKKKFDKELITNIGIALVLFGLLLLVITVYASSSFNLSYDISNVIIIISFIFELFGFGVIVYGLFKN